MKSMLKNIKKKFSKTEDAADDKSALKSTGSSGNLSASGAGESNATSSTANGTARAAAASTAAAKTKKAPVSAAAAARTTTNEKVKGQLPASELLKPMTTFQETLPPQRAALFAQHLKLCSITFDWHNEASPKDKRPKEVKRVLLLELVDFIGKNKNFYTERTLTGIIQMVSANLFRALPPRTNLGDDPEEDEPVFEPSWPHLQIVYEFFLRFIVSSELEVKVLKKYINHSFILRLLELFDSEDPRERDYLKTILHRIYAKFMALRAFIRKSINNVFYSFVYDTEKHNGVAELLEILGSVINGFALPLKSEHKTFLKKVLTPMHKVRPLASFHQQLSYCVTQFVDKDPTLAVPVITGLINYWPNTNSSKEVLFLNELEELLELTQPEEFQILLVPLFQLLNRTIGSPHFQVAERSLFLWHNEYISSLMVDHRDSVLDVIYPVLKVSSTHWNPTVSNLTQNVMKFFMELDASLVERCSEKATDAESGIVTERANRDATWAKLLKNDSAKKKT